MADDYRSKLEQFFALVPKSAAATLINKVSGAELLRGSPVGHTDIPIRSKADLPAAKARSKRQRSLPIQIRDADGPDP